MSFTQRKVLLENWKGAWSALKQNLRERGLLVLTIYLAFVGLTWPYLFPRDRVWLDLIRADGGETYRQLEDFFAVAGDFFWFNIVWSLAFVGWGLYRQRPHWYGIACVFLLGGALSGLTSRVIKMTAGRARPSMTDRSDLTYRSFVGPNPKAKTHGYPSGHAAASMGSATALCFYAPAVGLPCLAFASTVTYSRMYGNHHFPMDSIHGAGMGLAAGFLVARRKNKQGIFSRKKLH